MTDVVVIRPETDVVEGTLSLWVDLTLPLEAAHPAST